MTRILIVTRNLPPMVGGMERLNVELARALSAEFEVAVCGPEGAATHLPGIEVMEIPLAPLSRFLFHAGRESLRMSRRFRPRVVIAGSGLTAPLALIAARRARARALAYVHGLDLVVDQPVYQAFWIPAIRRMDAVIANSRATRETAVAKGVPRGVTDVVYCGAPVPNLAAAPAATSALPEGPFILSVGRLLRRKGLPEFIEHALPALLKKVPQLELVVIGGEATQALRKNRVSERQLIQAAAARVGLSRKVRLLGTVDSATLIAAFQRARAFVFPVLDTPGDVEGFGAVAIEAAAYGCPTVAFAVGGVADAVLHGQSGHLLEAGDYAGMVAALASEIEATPAQRQAKADSAQAFAARFSWAAFAEQIRAHVRRLAASAGP